jgi:hypothetical protein
LSGTVLADSTRHAIAACVRSIEEFEVFLCLARNRDRYSSAENIAADIPIPVALVSRVLEALASRSLLDVKIAGAVLYKLDPASDASRSFVEEMLAAVSQNRTAVMKAILTAPSVAHDFADAFRVDGKRRSDG